MRKTALAVMFITSLFLTGCASHLMQPIDESITMTGMLSDNESAIVFFRSTTFGGAIQAPVIEAVNEELKLVAIVSAGAKFLYKTTPGKHIFTVGGESSELLEADVEGGKTYYCYVSPRMGLFKARFVFVPVTDKDLATDGFKADLKWCKWYENKPEGQAWLTENMQSLQDKYTSALKDHQEAKPENKKTIKPEYGTAIPVQ